MSQFEPAKIAALIGSKHHKMSVTLIAIGLTVSALSLGLNRFVRPKKYYLAVSAIAGGNLLSGSSAYTCRRSVRSFPDDAVGTTLARRSKDDSRMLRIRVDNGDSRRSFTR